MRLIAITFVILACLAVINIELIRYFSPITQYQASQQTTIPLSTASSWSDEHPLSNTKTTALTAITPRPVLSEYAPKSQRIVTQYPEYFSSIRLSQGTISDRITLLPTAPLAKHYLVQKDLGVIVPLSLTDTDVWDPGQNHDFFASSQTDRLLASGGVIHPRGADEGLIIAGHSSMLRSEASPYATVFQFLALLQTGMQVQIYSQTLTDRGVTSYTVRQHSIIAPHDTASLQSLPLSKLILYTCYPFGTRFKRLIVELEKI